MKRPHWEDAVQRCPSCRGTLRWLAGRDCFKCRKCDRYFSMSEVRQYALNRAEAAHG